MSVTTRRTKPKLCSGSSTLSKALRGAGQPGVAPGGGAQLKTQLCGSCGSTVADGLTECDGCGSRALCGVIGDAIVSFPPGTPCPGCGSHDLPLVFRAWVRRTAFLIGSHETRSAGYLCHGCANRQTTIALVWTGLLGWWSITSFLFRAPRATFYNWVAAFRAPVTPLAWGAVHVADVIDDLRGDREYDATMAALHDSPFNALSDKQSELVYDAEGLYECLRVPWNATSGDLRRAYTARARAVHPDVRPSDRSANDEMIQLNRAWEILRDPQMRAAYDWLEANRTRVAA